ncbi:MAG: MFS transporter [Opitutales bacterium]|jgi:acyl-[acyl-carrier-protein]-phospholipid O-acyltransferase/long-chain-fatty-acid--[acyl-carrier-protein] ligase
MATQFQNAFSDNALKNLVILLVMARQVPGPERNANVALAGAMFAAPFILFSMFGGWLADRFSKQRVMATVKQAEIAIMLFAALALSLHSLPLELAAVFLMGCHSAIFGPSKYGILPEVLPHDRLSWGNGILELLTFLGIILGTVTGAFFAEALAGVPGVAGLILAGLAVLGWLCSRQVTPVPPAAPGRPLPLNPAAELWKQLAVMRQDRDLWRANWGNVGFFFVAALVQMNLLLHAKDVLGLAETKSGLLSAALALGIGLGSVVAGFASRGRIEYRLVPLGALGLALSTIPMGMAGVGVVGFSFALAALGFSAGFFIVPIAAVLQHRPSAESKGAVQGAANLLSFVGILAASGVQWVATEQWHLGTGQVFWVCGACAMLTGAYAAISRGRFIRAE